MNNTPRLLIYKSSAGSGKTYTLAKAYLKMLLASPCALNDLERRNYHRHILAVTFTNDAAREMKNRVLDYLKGFAYDNEKHQGLLNDIKHEIKDEYGFEIELNELKERSLAFLKTILHGFSEFNIMTIDAFTNQVSKSFARDLGLPFNYEVHLDQFEKISESVDNLVSNIEIKDQKLLEWLKQFMVHAVENQSSWNISNSISDYATSLGFEDKSPFIETLYKLDLDDFVKIKNAIGEELNRLTSEIKTPVKSLIEDFNKIGLEDNDFKNKSNGIFSFIRKLLDQPFLQISPTNLKYLNEGVIAHPKSENQALIESNQSKWIPIILEIVNNSMFNNARFIVLTNLMRSIYQIGVINLVKNELLQIQENEEIIFLNQLTEKIRNIIITEPVPYIYERIGVKFRHVLIDEFQDTSRFQWINFIPLISNALANGGDCLIVGDAKQSIYQWRGAEPQSIVELPKIDSVAGTLTIYEHGHQFNTSSHIRTLIKNWRSRDHIIAFNNDFFTWLRSSYSDEIRGLDGFYSDVIQELNGQKDGLVKISLLDENTEADDKMDIMLDFMMEEIKSLEANNHDLGRITILVRKNSEASLVAERLNEAQIKVISSESMLLKNSFGVKVIISLLKHLEDPFNTEKRLDLFNVILKQREIEPENWSKISNRIANTKLEFLEFINNYFRFNKPIEKQHDNLYQYVQLVTQDLKLYDNQSDQAYLDQLLEDIHSQSVRGAIDLSAYLDHWEKVQDSLAISSASSEKAIRVMSIHKAKGLEFSIVIMPFVDWSFKPRPNTKLWSLWPNSGIENLNMVILPHKAEIKATEFESVYEKINTDTFIENINMLYVAFTRAVDGLIIISRKNSASRTTSTVGLLIEKFLDSKVDNVENCAFNGQDYHQYLHGSLVESQNSYSDDAQFWDGSHLIRNSIFKKLKWQTENNLEDDLDTPLNIGELIHNLMSNFKFTDQRNSMLKEAEVLTNQNTDVINKVNEFVSAILSNELLLSFFQRSWKVLTEQEVLYEGKVLRPDRIQFKDDEVILIDYKTGKLQESHQKQVQLYIHAVKGVYPAKNIKGYLIYMEPFMFHEIEA